MQERVARLERDGIIAGYTVRLNEDPFLGGLQSHIMLTVDPKHFNTVVVSLKAMPEVLSCVAVSGAYDLIALAASPSTEDMDSLLDEIGSLPGVARTNSLVVLSTKFDRR